MKTFTLLMLVVIHFLFTSCNNKKTSPDEKPPNVGLHIAIAMGDIEAIEQHIRAGSDLNGTEWTRGSTPLIMAAAVGEVEAAKLLINAGADVNFTNDFGSTPLITASAFGKMKLAKLFIENGADINMINKEGSTALITASLLCHTEIVKLLLENGADKSLKNEFGRTAIMTVETPMDELKEVYEKLEKILNVKLDYERIKLTRPMIANLLQ